NGEASLNDDLWHFDAMNHGGLIEGQSQILNLGEPHFESAGKGRLAKKRSTSELGVLKVSGSVRREKFGVVGGELAAKLGVGKVDRPVERCTAQGGITENFQADEN